MEKQKRDSRQFRDVLGTFLTGVTVITTRDSQGCAYGVTANSFSSVSLDPPLILWSQAHTSTSFSAFQDCEFFAVNILSHEQMTLSNHFAKSKGDKFAEVTHRNGLGEVPLLDGAVASLECRKFASYPAGDHVIYIGLVEAFTSSIRRPLAFGRGKYLLARSHAIEASGSKPIDVEPAVIARVISALPAFAEQFGRPTLSLAVWSNHGPTVIHWLPGSVSNGDGLATGEVLSLTQSNTGLAFAAFAPPDLTDPYREEELHLHTQTDTNGENDSSDGIRARLENRIGQIRLAGMVRIYDSSVAFPLFAGDNALRLVLTVYSNHISDAETLLSAVSSLARMCL